MTFRMYVDTAKEWRWRLKATNGDVLADSGEGYKNKADCRSAIDSIKANAARADVTEG